MAETKIPRVRFEIPLREGFIGKVDGVNQIHTDVWDKLQAFIAAEPMLVYIPDPELNHITDQKLLMERFQNPDHQTVCGKVRNPSLSVEAVDDDTDIKLVFTGEVFPFGQCKGVIEKAIKDGNTPVFAIRTLIGQVGGVEKVHSLACLDMVRMQGTPT